jgi:hypothetical protein
METQSEAGGTTATTEGSGKTNFSHLLLLKTQNNDLGGLITIIGSLK